MGFWSDDLGTETKRAYRWVCYFNKFDRWLCKSVSKPSFSISETSHRFINHTFWYPGRVEWNSIDLTLVDPLDPDATMTIMHMIESAGYEIPVKQKEVWKTISKDRAVSSVKQMTIEQLGADGTAVEQWTLKSPWIKDVRFGNLSYDSDDIMDITLTIRYDWANLWSKNNAYAGAAPGVSAKKNFPVGHSKK